MVIPKVSGIGSIGEMKDLIIYSIIGMAIVLLGVCWVCADQEPYYKVIMAEAVGDGYQGMYAVACVIRNRGGDLDGFCGARR